MSNEPIPLSIPDYFATLTPEEREVKMASPAYKALKAVGAWIDARDATVVATGRVTAARAVHDRSLQSITARQVEHQAELDRMREALKPLRATWDEAQVALDAANATVAELDAAALAAEQAAR